MQDVQVQVRELGGAWADDRVKIWARIRWSGEPGIDVAREYRYRDGASVAHVIRRPEQRAQRDRTLGRRLESLRQRASV